MDILRSDKAPYVVALLVSLLGWHLAQLTDDIRSTRSVLYSVNSNSSSGKITALVHNVSKTHSLKAGRFSLACLPNESCFAANSEETKVHPPNGAKVEVFPDSTAITIVASLPAGGKITFGGRLRDKGRQPRFLFVPDEENMIDIYVFDGDGIRGFLVRNYFGLIFGSFVALALLLMFLIGRLFLSGSEAPSGPVPNQARPETE